MVHLETLMAEREKARKRAEKIYWKVAQKRKNETQDEIWRRKQTGLEWKADFLLESDAFFINCIYDGEKLKIPGSSGSAMNVNAGYNLGFEIPLNHDSRDVIFSLYIMDLDGIAGSKKRMKEIYQCPKCRLVYCLPKEIDIADLRSQRKPKPIVFGSKR